MKSTAILLFLFATTISVFGEAKINKEKDDLSADYANYTAYLELVINAVKNAEEDKTAQEYETIKNEMMLYSLLLASGGRSQDMVLKVVNSRIELCKKQTIEEIENDAGNISILMNKHHQKLIDIYQNPPKLLIDSIEEETKKIEAGQAPHTTPAIAPR